MGKTKTVEPVIRKVLDISTGHITKEDAAALDQNPPIALDKFEEGWYLYLGSGSAALEILEEVKAAGTLSDAFITILKWATVIGCDIIKLDADGPLYENLNQFEW